MKARGATPCPICGKPPSVSSSVDPGGAYVKIRCKPVFGHAHLEVERGGAYDALAYSKAVKAWNILAAKVSRAVKTPIDEVNDPDDDDYRKEIGECCTERT